MAYLERRRRRRPETGKLEDWWRIVERDGGRGSDRASHPLGYLTEAQAKQALKVFNAKRVLGVAPPTSAPGSASTGPTLREWWGAADRAPDGEPRSRIQLLCDARGLSSSERGVVHATRLLALAVAGDVLLADLTTAHGDALLSAMRDRALARRTQRAYLRWWHLALEVAHADGELREVPRVVLPRELPRGREHVWLTRDQTVALLTTMRARVAAGDVPGASLALVVLSAEGLLRPGEARTRRWEDVDWREGLLWVRPCRIGDEQWKPKGGRSRPVAITGPMLEVLREVWIAAGQPGEGWIAPSPTDPTRPVGDVGRSLARTCELAGLPPLHPHALRHTAAQRLLAAGVTLDALAAAGGWSSPETPMRIYTHPDPAAGLAAIRSASTGAPLGAPPARAGEVVPHPGVREKGRTNREK